MITIFLTGLVALGGYAVFDKLYPSPKKKEYEEIKFGYHVVDGDCVIYNDPQFFDSGNGFKTYRFRCNIIPYKARLANGSKMEMSATGDEFKIKEFLVGINPEDNTVEYVYLGENQYHCDKETKTRCLCLQEIYKTELNIQFLERLMELMTTYDIEDCVSHEHWEDESFKRSNSKIKNAVR